ncbi:MAG: carbohydrate binding family 9 domain-containing protein, partial [FCB group bacterium]|nr:carbohydrate binding family 9 domain-containing protein [FCB group bacterium]
MDYSPKHKTMLILCISLAGLILAATPALATKTFEPVYNPSLEILRATESITVNGRLDDLGWVNAARADNFVERSPGDMTRPAVHTETIITYDEDKLYVAFICHDNPNTIRATMCDRDQFGGDDAVALLIDTYGDATWAYEFYVNPYGVQKDRLWSAVAGEDAGFDLIWESAATITDSGYQVEIAIPFASMRFPSKDVQTWKMDFWRNRPRESFMQYSWAAYDRNEQCWPCQWGTVAGIQNVRPGKGLELLPAFVANQSGNLSGDDNFENGDIIGDLSLNGKYSISSNVIAEAAINPDFSQIEADAAQIDVNSTFALFYPERRPFFQEGSDIFRTLFNSFYTRTVNDPQLAAKVTGRMGGTTFGFFTAVDENSPYMIPLDQRSITLNTDKSVTNVLRGLQTVGDDSRVGVFFSDRRQDGGG